MYSLAENVDIIISGELYYCLSLSFKKYDSAPYQKYILHLFQLTPVSLSNLCHFNHKGVC